VRLALQRARTLPRSPAWLILSRIGLAACWVVLMGVVARLMAWSLAQVGSWLS